MLCRPSLCRPAPGPGSPERASEALDRDETITGIFPGIVLLDQFEVTRRIGVCGAPSRRGNTTSDLDS